MNGGRERGSEGDSGGEWRGIVGIVGENGGREGERE